MTEVAKVRHEFADPVQCGDLPSRISTPSPQSLGRWVPEPGQNQAGSDPETARSWASAWHLLATETGRELEAKTARSATVD